MNNREATTKPEAYRLNVHLPITIRDHVLWSLFPGDIFTPMPNSTEYIHEPTGHILMPSLVNLTPEWFTPIYEKEAIAA